MNAVVQGGGRTLQPAGAGEPWCDRAADDLPFDVTCPSFLADPYPHYERMREQWGQMCRLPSGGVVVLGYRECSAALRSRDFGHGARTTSDTTAYGLPARSFLLVDPPVHDQHRGRVAPGFTAEAIGALMPLMTEVLHERVSAFRPGDVCDVVTDVAEPLAWSVISSLLRVPEEFRQDAERLLGGANPRQSGDESLNALARVKFSRAVRKTLAAAPPSRCPTDLISLFTSPWGPDGLPATQQEALATSGLILSAGYKTSVGLIANGMRALLDHPDQLRLLTESEPTPEDISKAVEEFARFDPAIQIGLRAALTDTEIAGMAIPKGTPLLLLLGAANRDPHVFDHPQRLDVTRTPRHLAFGAGKHFCLGAQLARVQARKALTVLLQARPQPAGAAEYDPRWVTRHLRSLPVRLSPNPEIA
ncbi:cytochrome P450 [Streptomyces sp. DK15]|uniref:cytochrome P450 n=1 Tax=Streptomyces sp. DK15 TaxID=2957499 RepID=UPI0029BC0696|nr:cytochrome P450 [Streptomyces sp. DK15]MDX2394122.1 cytochrome P450 [Streptomyces sp. DK15]